MKNWYDLKNYKESLLNLKINLINLNIERNEYSCYIMLSSEISKLCCLWACLDWESYRRSKKNVDYS